MLTRITMPLGVLLASVALVSGCGDDSETASTATAEKAPTSRAAESPPDGESKAAEPRDKATDTTSRKSGDTSPPTLPKPKTIEEAVDTCLAATDQYKVSEARKEQMRETCEAFGSDDEERKEAAARKLCDEIVPKGTLDRQTGYDMCVKGLEQGFAQ